MKQATLEIVDGCLEWSAIPVFEFGDLWIDPDSLEDIPQHNYPLINQWSYKETKSACTIVNALKEAWYLWWMEANDDEMIESVKYATTQNYIIGKPRYADLWMRSTEKFFEMKYPDKKLYYSTLTRDSPNFIKLLQKWYMLWCTYKGNDKYNADYRADCILDGDSFGNPTYGHRTSIKWKDGKIYVYDSYAGHKYNVYELKQFVNLVKNKVFWETFFVFTKEINVDSDKLKKFVQMKALTTDIEYKVNQIKSLSSDVAYKKVCDDYLKVNRNKLKDIEAEIKKLS